jgi:hypothetical protein
VERHAHKGGGGGAQALGANMSRKDETTRTFIRQALERGAQSFGQRRARRAGEKKLRARGQTGEQRR